MHTNTPEGISREHLLEIAKKCGLIGSYTTAEIVDAVTGYARVVLADKAVQEAFVAANQHLLKVGADKGRGVMSKLKTDQEPVAWLYVDQFGFNTLKLSQVVPHEDGAFPVYRHPAPVVSSEPTAWVKKTDTSDFWWLRGPIDDENYYRLYTTPQARTLSDEEILAIANEIPNLVWEENSLSEEGALRERVIEFARAVLKEASK